MDRARYEVSFSPFQPIVHLSENPFMNSVNAYGFSPGGPTQAKGLPSRSSSTSYYPSPYNASAGSRKSSSDNIKDVYTSISSTLLHETESILEVANATQGVREAEQRYLEIKTYYDARGIRESGLRIKQYKAVETARLQQLHDVRKDLARKRQIEADLYSTLVENLAERSFGTELDIRKLQVLETMHNLVASK